MQLARKGPVDRGRESFHEYRSILGSSVHVYPSRLASLCSRLSFVLLSFLVPDKKFAPRRSREISGSSRRRRRYAKDISARSILPRVIARYEFHVALARKTTFDRAFGTRGKNEGRGRRRITGRGEKPGGSSNSLLQPRVRQRARLRSKNVTCVRQSQARSYAALRPPGNSKEIYGPPRVLAVARHDAKRRSRGHSMAAREKHAIAKSIQFAIL